MGWVQQHWGGRLRRHPLVALAAFLAVGLATLWAAFSPPERFEATSVVSVQPAAPNVSTQSVEYLIPGVEQRIASESFHNQVRRQLVSGMQTADWVVSTSTSPGSGVLRISINSERQDVVRPVANTYASYLTGQDLSQIPVEVIVVNPASGALSLSNRSTILVSGFGLAAILAGLTALVRLSWAEAAEPTSPFPTGREGAVAVAGRLAESRSARRHEPPLREKRSG